MSENEMNEQPTGDQPASAGGNEPTETGSSRGWRPPSEPTATNRSPWAPTPSAPGAEPAEAPSAAESAAASGETGPASGAPDGAPSSSGPSSAAPSIPAAESSDPTAQYPTGQYPAGQYPAGQYPTGQYPAGQAPAGQAPAGQAPAGQYPTAQYPASQYPTGQYPTGQYPAGQYPAGQAPVTGAPQYPYGQPGDASGANYPTGYAPASSYPATGPSSPGRRRGLGTIAALVILGLVLAAGGGVAGAALMHHFDGDNVTVARAGTIVDNAPIVDRSSLANIASTVSPSVVSITTQSAEGSGVVLSSDGYILTNNHVAATASGSSVQITFSNGNSTKATLVGTDAKTDLAVFKAQNVSNLTAAKFGDSAALQVGDTVLAIGSPLGLDGSVTAGIVSALNRTINEAADNPSPQSPQDPFGQGNQQQQQQQSAAPTIAGAIQTDAAINPGNSGGALVNTSGQVVGINTAIATNGGAEGNIGVGFAIPSDRAKQVADDLIKGVKVSHPQLGVSVSTAASSGGAQISSVSTGSAAASAGIKAGDVITGFSGKPVHTSDDLLNDVQMGTVGKTYALTVVRNGQSMNVNVTLQESK